MLAIAGFMQWRARFAPCPLDPALREACLRGRRMSRNVYLLSMVIFAVGAWFAFAM
jgi:hypothetical protein